MKRREEEKMSHEHHHGHGCHADQNQPLHSELRNWPVQIKLAPTSAPYFDGAKLLIAADCTAYAYVAMHRDYMKGKVIPVWLYVEYDDYNFDGWFDAKEGGNFITDEETPFTPSSDITLYTHWSTKN